MLQTFHICSLCRWIGQYINQWINPRSLVLHFNSFIKSFPCTLFCVLVFIFTTFALVNSILYQFDYEGWLSDITSGLLSVFFTAIFFTVIWIFLELMKIFIERKTSVVLPEIDPDGFLVENIDSSGDQVNLGQSVKITTRRLALTDENQRFELQRSHLQVNRRIPLGFTFSESLSSNQINPFSTSLQAQLKTLNTLTTEKIRAQRCSNDKSHKRVSPASVPITVHLPKEVYHKAPFFSSCDDNSLSSYSPICSPTQASLIPRIKSSKRCNLTRKMLHKHGENLSKKLCLFNLTRTKLHKVKTMEPEFKKEIIYKQYNIQPSENNSESTDTASEEESKLRTLKEKSQKFKECRHSAKQLVTQRVSTSEECDLSANTLASTTKHDNIISTHFDAKNSNFTLDCNHVVVSTSNEVVQIASTSNNDSSISWTSRNCMVDATIGISYASDSRKPILITPKDLISSLTRETLSEASTLMKILPVGSTVDDCSLAASTLKEDNSSVSSTEVAPIDSRSKQDSLIISSLGEEHTTSSCPEDVTSIILMSKNNLVSSTSRSNNSMTSISIGNCSESPIENLKRLLTLEFDDLNTKSQNLTANNVSRYSKDLTKDNPERKLKRKRRSKSAPSESFFPPFKIARFMEGRIEEN